MPCGLPWSEGFVRQLADKELRDEFVADKVRTRIAVMIRALREQGGREWSQSELGQKMGKPQSVVSRLENPDYGKASLQTLLDVAAAYDLPVMVDFPEWDDWFRRIGDLRSPCLHRASFDVEKLAGQAQAAQEAVASRSVIEFDYFSPNLPRTSSTPRYHPAGRNQFSVEVSA